MKESDFVVGQFYRTHNNQKVKLVAKSRLIMQDCLKMVFETTDGDLYITNSSGERLICGVTQYYNKTNVAFGGGGSGGFSSRDIKCKWVDPIKVSGWVCVYDGGRIGTTIYPTLEEAMRNKNSHIVDRIFVESKKNEGSYW